MASSENDDIPMLRGSSSSSSSSSSRMRSVSFSMPKKSVDYEHNLVGFTGPLRIQRADADGIAMTGPLQSHRLITEPKRVKNEGINNGDYRGKNEHLLRSGQLGECNDPYCTTCPIFYNRQKPNFDDKFHNMIYGDAKGWSKRMWSCLLGYIPGVMNSHTKAVQKWNQFFVISCFFAVFLDPLFFLLMHVDQDNKCMVLNWPMTIAIVSLRSLTDIMYMLHILLQFRLAYVAPETRIDGSGDLIDDPQMIAKNYFFGRFFIDLIVALPLPQIIIFTIFPGSTAAYNPNIYLGAVILIQLFPRLCRFFPLVSGSSSPTGFIFESAWSDFAMNLLMYILASHAVGSCWYALGLQRVNKCFVEACSNSNTTPRCREFIYGRFENDPTWELWKNNPKAKACFEKDGFEFGVYERAVNLTTHTSMYQRYEYSLLWGFQQISTLAGNQVPSYDTTEVYFIKFIIGLGLLLFAFLIGNMQNFLQAIGRRRLEMCLRRHDVEQWMSHRGLPLDLQRQVRHSERFNWAATRGVNEEMLMENLPDDLQRGIRRHLFKLNKVRIFKVLDEPIVDAMCERLRTKTYIKGSKILDRGGVVDKMVFIIRGQMVSTGEDGIASYLSEGDVCGEELLSWCLESWVHKDGARIRIPGERLLSTRVVSCLTNTEAFVLGAEDVEQVTRVFARFLRRVQGAIRYDSPYWKGVAVRRIQSAWRRRKRRINQASEMEGKA